MQTRIVEVTAKWPSGLIHDLKFPVETASVGSNPGMTIFYIKMAIKSIILPPKKSFFDISILSLVGLSVFPPIHHESLRKNSAGIQSSAK